MEPKADVDRLARGDIDIWIPVDAVAWVHWVHLPVDRCATAIAAVTVLVTRAVAFRGQQRAWRAVHINGDACRQAAEVIRAPAVGAKHFFFFAMQGRRSAMRL